MLLVRNILKSIFLLTIAIFSAPTPAVGAESVLINEVAWMGTVANTADEWVELYNPTSLEVDLAGWGFYEAGGGTLVISLSGKIQPGGYYLIERTDDNSISDITGDIFGSFTGWGFKNSGENLVLKNSSGAIVDSVDASAGWPAGDNALKASMERKADGSWQTNNGVTINGKDANGNSINGTPKSANSGSPNGSTSTAPVVPGSSSAASASSDTAVILKADAGSDVAIEAGYPLAFNGLNSKGATTYKWYLGDGSVKDGAEITYVYNFPGTYIATLEVSSGGKIDFDQIKVVVFGGKAIISEIFAGSTEDFSQWVELYNPNGYPLDVSGWILESGQGNFTLPPFVIIPKDGFIVFSKEVTGLDFKNSTSVKLKYPSGLVVDEVVFENFIFGMSASRSGGEIFWTKEPTPGRANIVLAGGMAISESLKTNVRRVEAKSAPLAKNYVASFYGEVKEFPAEENNSVSDDAYLSAAVGFWQNIFGELLFWIAIAIVLGLIVSFVYLRFSNKSKNNDQYHR